MDLLFEGVPELFCCCVDVPGLPDFPGVELQAVEDALVWFGELVICLENSEPGAFSRFGNDCRAWVEQFEKERGECCVQMCRIGRCTCSHEEFPAQGPVETGKLSGDVFFLQCSAVQGKLFEFLQNVLSEHGGRCSCVFLECFDVIAVVQQYDVRHCGKEAQFEQVAAFEAYADDSVAGIHFDSEDLLFFYDCHQGAVFLPFRSSPSLREIESSGIPVMTSSCRCAPF